MIRPFVCLLAASVILGGLPAVAADLSPHGYAAPSQRWAGCHVSLQGSYDSMDASTKYGSNTLGVPEGQPATKDLEPRGLGIGGGLGCDWQSGQWLFGLLADGAFTDLDDDALETAFLGYRYRVESDWFATLRGRIGYAQDRGLIFDVPTLWYLTAGVAWAGLEVENDFANGFRRTKDSQTATGWTIGWGTETALDNRWSFKTETLYVDYGEDTFLDRNDPVSNSEMKIDTTAWVSRIGITYKLTDW